MAPSRGSKMLPLCTRTMGVQLVLGSLVKTTHLPQHMASGLLISCMLAVRDYAWALYLAEWCW
jgi:hypothetical protein